MISTCIICGLTFDARHSYGLCPLCISTDRLREHDRVESAVRRARKEGILPTSLCLTEWLSTLSDYAGMCAFCGEYAGTVIELLAREQGLVYDNTVPACRACHKRRNEGYDAAEDRVRMYLHAERVQHYISRNDGVHEPI